MGCASSTPATEVQQTKPSEVHENFSKRRKNSVHNLEAFQQESVRKLFDQYRKSRLSASDGDGGEDDRGASVRLSSGGQQRKVMKKDGLRKILAEVDDQLFDFLWNLFDADKSGMVESDEFVMAMALLSTGIGDSVEAQLEAAFCMFDSDKTGELTAEEFESMVQATVNLNLDHLLESDHGAEAFEAQLQKEFSDENLAFWQAVRDWRRIDDDAERTEKAKELMDEYVKEGSMRQVNLPSSVAKDLTNTMKACFDKGSPPEFDAFDAAQFEIFKLMERDTFSRFKNDPAAIEKLVDGYYAKAAKGSKSVSFAAFREWALHEPAVLVFFTGLCNSVNRILAERTSSFPTQKV